LGGVACVSAAAAAAPDTLQQIRDRGRLVCGTSQGVAGFSAKTSDGRWVGFDTDICRALAAAIFDDPEKVTYVPLSSKDRLIALQSGDIDVLPRTTTWTLSRNTMQGLTFTAVNYFDGQGFMVKAAAGVKGPADLGGATICVAQGTTSELNLGDYAQERRLSVKVATFSTTEDAIKAYEAGRCDAYTTDVSGLVADRLKLARPDEHVILPDLISKEPLGPWVRKGDERWFDIVRWTVFALLTAEELGVTAANVEAQRTSTNPEVKRLLGADAKLGETLGLSNDWVVRVVRNVGNYGESFERHLGSGSPLKLPRGANALWSRGGLQYSPPFR